LLCDRARIVWPVVEIDAREDLDSTMEGVQLDLVLRSNLAPGGRAVLSVGPVGGVARPHPDAAPVEDDGSLRFASVTVPLGRIQLSLVAHGECGAVSSARQLYVW